MHLNIHSYFSFLYGTFSPAELIEKAQQLGVNKFVLTDINNSSGFYETYLEGKMHGVEVIPGVEFKNDHTTQYIAIAKNEKGFAEINHHLSHYLKTKEPLPDTAPEYENVIIIYPLNNTRDVLKKNEWIGIKHWELNQLFRTEIDLHKAVALHPVTFDNKIKFNLHRLLRAIDYNTLLSKLSKVKEANPNELFISPQELSSYFKDYPELLKNTQNILSASNYKIDLQISKNRNIYKSNAKDEGILRKLGEDGLKKRYKVITTKIRERFESEIETIKKLDFSAYYLITWDIIQFAKSKGYYHVGRGSGANSLVAYCLGVTDVDPIELDLYFERFINLHRTSPPDFDIDFSWDERDEVTQYVFDKYGEDYVALLATVTTFQGRSPYRELAKVFGIPKAEIDDMIANPQTTNQNEYSQYVFRYAPLLKDFPVNLSIHAGGVLISEKPIYHYTALQAMPKGFPVSQFDMYTAEDIGFAKFDILSQRGLGHIKTAIRMILENQGVEVDIHKVNEIKNDPRVRQQLADHETMGCFYIESPAMRQLIWKLNCDNYISLVAASSIIRPGVASSGMMAQYIRYHHQPDTVKYLHPIMAELLEETYGIMVYQEDVIRVAHYFAGLTLAEADVLRRGMSGKSRSKREFDKIAQKWFDNCKAKGYSDELAKEVWRQIESFSGYSFSKAHSASYAVESFQSLYLKTYYPLEFIVAVVNNFGGFYDTDMYLREASRYGAKVYAPDINHSLNLTKVEGENVWIGFVHIKGLEKNLVDRIISDRDRNGNYYSLYEFYKRVNPGLEQLSLLIKIDAFRTFKKSKKELYWEAYYFIQNIKKEEATLFELDLPKFELPEFTDNYIEDAYDEIELLGFTVGSPFKLLKENISNTINCTEFPLLRGKNILIYGYLANYKVIRTKTGKRMSFGYFMDKSYEYFDIVSFPQVFLKYPYRGKGIYKIEGKVIEEFGFYSVQVTSLEKCKMIADPRLL